MYDIQHCFICRPSDYTVSEDAGIEPRTVAITALAFRRSCHSARSYFFPSQLFLSTLQRCGATTMAFLFSVFWFLSLIQTGDRAMITKIHTGQIIGVLSLQGWLNFCYNVWNPRKLALLSHIHNYYPTPKAPVRRLTHTMPYYDKVLSSQRTFGMTFI